MRAFEFRLDTVLRYQERRKKLDELRRQQAAQALARAEDEARRLGTELATVAADLAACVGGADGRTRWESLHAQARWLTDRLGAAEQAVAQARTAFAAAHAAYRKIATQVEALLELRRRAWRAHRDAADREDQERLEELVLRRWSAAASGDEDPERGGVA